MSHGARILAVVLVAAGWPGLAACGTDPADSSADSPAESSASGSGAPSRSGTPDPATATVTAAPSVPAVPAKPAPPEAQIHDGSISIGDRSLFLDCQGKGTPVVVFETQLGGGRFSFADVEDQLVRSTTVCTYDRAGDGQSEAAAAPRTARDVVGDLHALLTAAGVPAPYLLVGSSAGADFAVDHARLHPEDVAGVLAWNPVLLDPAWGPALDAVTPAAGRQSLHSFLSGDDGGPEAVDWYTSARQATALPAPDDVPLLLLQSDQTECMGMADCEASNPTMVQLVSGYAAAWPGATYATVAEEHFVDQGNPDLVAALLEDYVASSRAAG
jgi:pimeloyl-ACP methyl ester carboxylesterase